MRPELNEFLAHLTEADTLVVLLNLADLDNLPENPRNAESVWITRGIFDFAQKLPHMKRKLLVFTQADRYASEIKSAGGAQAVFAKKLPMLKTLYPDLRVTTVTAVSGMDAEGRPKADYSVAGCYEFMRSVLAEENVQIMAAKARCDALYQRLKNFKVGGPDEFNGLTTTYCAAYEDLRGKVKPLWQSHCQIVEKHYKDVIVCFELNRAIRKCVKERSIKELAQEQCWAKGLSGFDGCAAIVVAFREHCRNEVEVQRKDVRSALWMVGLIILFFVGAMLFALLLAPAAK